MDKPVNERLASVEAKLEFIQDLLKEIRDDLKDQPSKEDYLDLKTRVLELEKTTTAIKVKVFAVASLISLFGSGLGTYIIQLITGK